MNITYLIGNGFDVNIGIKSRYADFYKYYANQHPDGESDVVKRFKNEINEYIKKDAPKNDPNTIDWRDLEVALGQFTESMTEEEGEPLYLDINDSLKHYLNEEYKSFDAEAFKKEDFLKHLNNPISSHFNRVTINIIRNYLGGFSGSDNINIINFNYTTTIEELSGFKGKPLSIGNFISGRQAYLNGVYHIHQTLDDDEILVGLNDVSQIANKQFHENRFLCNLFIKPLTNSLLGTGVDQDCEQLITNTDLFILFGTSVSRTDQKWWKAVCERLVNSNARLIYFVHSTQKRPHQNLYIEEMRNDAIKKLFANAGKEVDVLFDKVIPRCIVSFSDTMFRMPVNYGDRIKDEKTYKIGDAEVIMRMLDMSMRHVAVSVDAPNEESGVAAETMWIKDFFPGFTHNSHSLLIPSVDGNEVPYDYIPIHNKDRRKDIYFEISSFLGKRRNIQLKSMTSDKKIEALKSIIKDN